MIESYMNIHRRISKLVKQCDKYGKADDVFLDQLNIKRDEDLNGEQVLRDAEGLHLRRATIINHQATIEKRELAWQAICTSKIT